MTSMTAASRRLFLLFFCLAVPFGVSIFSAPETQAQVFLEFTWTLEETDYEGLLYVPTDQRPTMTVRILDTEGKMSALVLEKVDLANAPNGTIRLICSDPIILHGELKHPHLPETFSASDQEHGKVTNGKAEALYEINMIVPTNIAQIVGKYILEENRTPSPAQVPKAPKKSSAP